MARVRFSRRAVARLDDIGSYISERDPAAAARVLAEIDRAAALIGEHPRIGRPARVADLRVFVTRRHRYRVIYRVECGTVEIRDVLHPRQSPPGA